MPEIVYGRPFSHGTQRTMSQRCLFCHKMSARSNHDSQGRSLEQFRVPPRHDKALIGDVSSIERFDRCLSFWLAEAISNT
jgi:hypothetical protein